MRFLAGLLALLSACSVAAIGGPTGGDAEGADAGAGAAASDARPGSADARPATPIDAGVKPPDATTGDAGPVVGGAVALLDVHAMDVWAAYLQGGASLRVTRGGAPVAETGFPVRRVALVAAGELRVQLDAEDHDPLDVTVRFDGSTDVGAVTIRSSNAAGRAGVVLSHARETVGGRSVVVHRLFLGLRHQWFAASGRPARRGNAAALYIDHEDAWTHVADALRAARSTIHVTSWWFDSTFELIRSLSTSLTTDQRRKNTILAMLEASPAVKRVLIGQFLTQDGILEDHTTDDAIRAKGSATGDRFEYMGQANPSTGVFQFALDPFRLGPRLRAAHPELAGGTFDAEADLGTRVPAHTVDMTDWPIDGVEIPHASMHQKLIVIDEQVAFVGGLNFHPDDWDGPEHRVYDARRMDFDASAAERAAVAARTSLPDRPPRKDYMMRIDGPAVQDVSDVFKLRWDLAIDERVDYSANASRFSVGRAQGEAGDLQVQITTTLPDPLWEHSIVESWLNAVSQAERYIYIEDQYFRAPILNDAIYQRMMQVPGLKLVVVSMPVSEWTDPGCEWTARSHELFRDAFGSSRFQAVLLRSFDSVVTWGFDETEARFIDVYTHSKMLIIDDRFMSVGSCNKNNRGLIYEAEMNVAVLDDAWVAAQRRRILANLMPSLAVSDDPAGWFAQIKQVREWNDYVRAGWEAEGDDLDLDGAPLPERYRPVGLLYTLTQGEPTACLLEGVGPDVM